MPRRFNNLLAELSSIHGAELRRWGVSVLRAGREIANNAGVPAGGGRKTLGGEEPRSVSPTMWGVNESWNVLESNIFCDRVRLFWIYIYIFFFIVWYFFIFYRTNTSRNTEQLTVIQSASKWSVAAYLLSETDKLHVETIWRPRLRLTRRHDGRNLNLRLVLFPWIRTDCRSVSPQRCPHYFSLKSEWLSLQPQHEKLSECFIWNKARLWAGSKPVSV